uniref:Putative diguanylate cyclase AdrA n=1 Tax=Serratia marcescens TaxID=615 RepID=A0A1C3HA61_SERMA|nr:putative diguanylate cyclase AdrA [Serratia marcescens]
MYIAPPIFDARKSGLSFAKRTYLPRVAGLGLGFICVCASLYPLAPPTAVWLLLAFHGFLWPHLAYRLACRAKDPFKAEIRNLLIDSAFGGFWAAMMAFNALPAIVILSMMSMNNIASAGNALFVKGLAIQLAAAALTGALLGFPFHPHSTPLQIYLCLPMIYLYPTLLGLVTYRTAKRLAEKKTGAATHQHPRWADRLVQPPPLGASAASPVRQLPPLPGQRHADPDGYRSFQNHQRYFRPCAGG